MISKTSDGNHRRQSGESSSQSSSSSTSNLFKFPWLRKKDPPEREKEKEKARWMRETERTLERTLGFASVGSKGHHSGANGVLGSSGAGEEGATGTMGGMNLRCTTLNSNGDVTTLARSFSRLELCTRYGLQPRDLRKLDSGVPTVVPTILVRKQAILLTILHLRVVITEKEVSLFDSVGTEDSWLKGVFVWHLEHALKAGPKTPQGHLPYELRALESCLISVTTALENEMVNIRGLVVDLLEKLEGHIERDNLLLLLRLSRKLSAFQKRATLVQECLEEVLENDDDLDAMYLTAKAKGTGERINGHEEVELLLESFGKQCEEIVSEVEGLNANVRTTEDIIELILDSNRNTLLGLDLKVSICTLGITTGALVAGLFGMNLTTHLETHPYAFHLTALFSFSLAGVVTIVGLRRLRKMRKVALGVGGGGVKEIILPNIQY
ncbi:cora-domain-containing protein [Meredithblackwellia eburnea MCA 4105]